MRWFRRRRNGIVISPLNDFQKRLMAQAWKNASVVTPILERVTVFMGEGGDGYPAGFYTVYLPQVEASWVAR